MTGYTALREVAAILDLTGRGKIRATGEDRARLLHAMTTNHIQQLQPGGGCYAFFLSAQGRILADVNIMAFEDHILLDTEPETRQVVFDHLDKFIIADDVTLEDATDSLATIAVEGPLTAQTLIGLGARLPESDGGTAAWGGRVIAKLNATGQPGFWIFAADKDALLAALRGAGAVEATADEARLVRLENGKPRYGEDITDTYLPAETRQMRALHFSKGCYLGQEIVERVRSRGLVHRLLHSLEIDARAVPPAGAAIMDGDKKVGTLTSAAFSPTRSKVVAMGYVRAEHLTAALSVDGLPAKVIQDR